AHLANEKTKKAIKLLEHVVECRATLDGGDTTRLASQYELAAAYQQDGRFKEAIEPLEHVVEVEATILDEEDPVLHASQHEFASAYHS
ncbi:hypothetical protein LY76DRAFT_465392, partial [Colletotrichum caudatum]